MNNLQPINPVAPPPIYWWRPAAWLRVSGADSLTFLQGQFTNDLRSLAATGGVYGLWLNVKGKVVADSFIARGGEDVFWVGSYFSPAAVIRERLESFIIADDVVIEDCTADWRAVSVMGASLLKEEPAAGVRLAGRRSVEPALEWVFPVTEEAAVRARCSGAAEENEDGMTRRRIAAGIPAIPLDVGPSDLPNEAGLETDAISFKKGCYLGQEVMARLQSMGRVRRRLRRVRSRGPAIPAPGAALFCGGRPAGEMRSAVVDGAGGAIGLAMLSLLALTPDGALSLGAELPATWELAEAP